MLKRIAVVGLMVSMCFAPSAVAADADAGVTVDKNKKTITVPAKVAPRKLEKYDQIYPIEVVACAGFKEGGEKAHETVVTIDVKPSEVHKALESLGLKPGKPAVGEEAVAEGPELKISIELPNGKIVPIEKTLVDKKTGKAMPPLKWHFTGSAMKQLDPNKPEQTYGADVTRTLIGIFPVTNFTVIQSNLTMKDEPVVKMETNKNLLPPEGTSVKLIITPAGK